MSARSAVQIGGGAIGGFLLGLLWHKHAADHFNQMLEFFMSIVPADDAKTEEARKNSRRKIFLDKYPEEGELADKLINLLNESETSTTIDPVKIDNLITYLTEKQTPEQTSFAEKLSTAELKQCTDIQFKRKLHNRWRYAIFSKLYSLFHRADMFAGKRIETPRLKTLSETYTLTASEWQEFKKEIFSMVCSPRAGLAMSSSSLASSPALSDAFDIGQAVHLSEWAVIMLNANWNLVINKQQQDLPVFLFFIFQYINTKIK